jgi:hypothetical protein
MSSDDTSSSDVVEEVTLLVKPDHVALYIAPPPGSSPPASPSSTTGTSPSSRDDAANHSGAVKFLVSETTTFETLLEVVRIKFDLAADDPLDIAVVTSLRPLGKSLSPERLFFFFFFFFFPFSSHKRALQAI